MNNISRVIIMAIVALFFLLIRPAGCTENDARQEIEGFSAVQYGDDGKKKWQLKGENAEIEEKKVFIENISGLAFGAPTYLKVKARQGIFDRDSNEVRLKKDITLKTTDGTTLKTDSLELDSEAKSAFTNSGVEIKKSDLEVKGSGAICNLGNKTARIKKEVTATIDSDIGPEPGRDSGKQVVVTCDGPLQIDYAKKKATFLNNVKIKDSEGIILADRLDVYFDSETKRIRCVVARGNVRVINGENVTYSDKAIYLVEQKRVVLPQRPRLIIQTEKESY